MSTSLRIDEYIVEIGIPFGEVKIKERLIRCRDCEYCDRDSEYRSGDMYCQYHSSFQDGLDGFCKWAEPIEVE